ncbi:MAG TPA: VWA domain-containing protein [Vicinamibacterales bacterium]|nr:VWA domain-containing protein [Vicinamibacterales bacterium]
MKTTAVFLICCAMAVAAAAQQTSAQPPRATFSSSVDLVSVDVNVIDREGRPVRDLDARDFTLTVDGRVRKIASAQFISVTAPSLDAAPPPADYTSNVGTPIGRLIAIVIDRGSIAPVRAKDVFAAAARFVEQLRPADRVALLCIPSGPTVDFTTDHDAVTSALLRTDGMADAGPHTKNVAMSEAMQFERGNTLTIDLVTERECGGIPKAGPGMGGGQSEVMMCAKIVKEEAGIRAAFAHERARNTLAGLRTILERLSSSETPKTLVLVSESLVIEGDRAATANLARAVAAAHATIYALKPEPSDSDASQARAPQSRAQDRATLEEGLAAVARIGGGEMFRVIANPDFAFGRITAELSGYYLLGFEPEAEDRDGKEHSIAVKVQRGGLSVRSRPEFTVGPARHKNDQQSIADLLRSPAIATDLPFRLTTYAFQDSASPKIRLLVAMEVDRPADPKSQMAMGVVLVQPGGDVGANFFQPAIAAPANASSKPQRSFATLLVDPGQYILKAAVVDTDGRRGSIERPVKAYMTRMSRFRATELLIGDEADNQGLAARIVPTITGDIGGDELLVYLELFGDAPAAFEGTTVGLEVSPAGSTTVVQNAPASLQPVGEDGRCRAVAGALPLSLLPAGSYVARVIVSVDGRKVGQMARPFRLQKK